jgi:hypothetical protein
MNKNNLTKLKLKEASESSRKLTCFELLSSVNDDKASCKNKSCRFNFSNLCNGCALATLEKSEKERLTLQEIGDLYDLSRMRICQLEKQIVEKVVNSF